MDVELKQKIQLIMELLEQTTSKEVFSSFLKGKGLHYSGSWSDLLEKRAIPYIDQGKVKVDELVKLLADSDEYGRQHIFLYKIKADLFQNLKKDKLLPVLVEKNLDSVISEPLILDKPNIPTISSIRWENNESALILKVISSTSKYESVSEETIDDYFIKKYRKISSRSVNVIKINDNGLVEVRISSKSNSIRYFEDVADLLRMFTGIIPVKEIFSSPVNLLVAKNKLWEDKSELSDIIRFSDATLRNEKGTTLKGATGTKEADLTEDETVTKSLNNFLDGDAYCSSNNIFFKTIENASTPSKEIHVLMSGEINEYAITVYCKKYDYNYVLNELIKFNK
jgi:hypothetical protein